jgi:hypothetical protein
MLEHGMGAPFLFAPDEYLKGSGGRRQPQQPCDLVWWCRDTAFLINITSISRSFEKATAHNLDALRGLLRVWREGRAMTGRNDFRSIRLEASEVDHVVLLSVVDVPSAVAHARAEATTGGTLTIASLPQEVLQTLVSTAGSALDLADFLLALSRLDRPASVSDAAELLMELRRAALDRAKTNPQLRRDRDNALDLSVGATLMDGARRSAHEHIHNANERPDSFAVFNDLDWERSVYLVAFTADTIRIVRDAPVGAVGLQAARTELPLDPYLFVVGVADAHQMVEAGKAISDFAAERRKERPQYPPFLLYYPLLGRPNVQLMPTLLAGHPQLGPTLTGQRLEAIG